MIDKLDSYNQAYLNLETAARTRLDPKMYEGYFKEDLDKMSELLYELKNIPDEIGFKDENDILRLKAFIKEELRRNNILAHSLDCAIELLKENHICPKHSVCPSNDYEDFRNCDECWVRELIYCGSKNSQDLPFVTKYKTR